jgi:hypothetical protein
LIKASLKQLRKGDKFFTPITQFNAVFDSSGKTLETRLHELNSILVDQ